VAELMRELNPDVHVQAMQLSPLELIDKHADFFKRYQLVIAAHLDDEYQVKVGKIC